ncbi:MAG: calcium-binding protein [Gemmobacter sp.]|nr:calcium-binding protein [Gemmobacter sp.]
MSLFRHVTTFRGGVPGFLTGITDLEMATLDGVVRLYAANRSGGGLSVFGINTAGGLGLVGQETWRSGLSHLGVPQLAVLTTAQFPVLVPVGMTSTSDGVYALTADGAIGWRIKLKSSGFADDLISSTVATINGRQILFAGRDGYAQPVAYLFQVTDTPVTQLSGPVPGASVSAPGGAHPDRMIATTAGGVNYLITASELGDHLSTYRIEASGRTVLTDQVATDSGIGFATPSGLAVAQIGGQSFVIVAAAGSSSLTVMQVMPNGQLIARDHVIDDLNTRFQRVTALDTVTLGDRVYVLAGGGDDGISLFTLLPDGRLLHLDTLADTLGTTLANVTALRAVAVNGQIMVFVASGHEEGLTQFSLSVGPAGVTRIGGLGSDLVQGTPADDVLSGGDGADTLMGGDGDDILIDGTGRDVMWGGPGADVFVLTPDGETDQIMDYQQGIDRIDLSAFSMLRSLQQLTITTPATGARITFRNETIDITAMNRLPIPVSHFTDAELFNISRFLIRGPENILAGSAGSDRVNAGNGGAQIYGFGSRDTLTGGNGNDRLFGDDGDDELHGASGDDVLTGGMGNDLLSGGPGMDTLYSGEGADTLSGGPGDDVIHGEGHNDRAYGMGGNDSMFGGTGDDMLSGGLGSDLLDGGPGNDLMIGDEENDTLLGGDGNDTLHGGLGDDRMEGGPGNDEAHGSAGQDQFFGGDGNDLLSGGPGFDTLWGGRGDDSLSGGPGNDLMYGDDGNDRLWGMDGNDRQFGGAGGDMLSGGFGDDFLDGGTGDDTLIGDAGADTLIGGAGNDEVHGGTENDHLDGGDGNDTVVGGPGNDILLGGAGNDSLIGGPGADTLRGGTGADVLEGGSGADVLFGGDGADRFVFRSITDSPMGGATQIADFTPGSDLIDLSLIDANVTRPGVQSFVFIGEAAFFAGGQLRYTQNGQNGLLLGDVNGDGVADFLVRLNAVAGFQATDLLL